MTSRVPLCGALRIAQGAVRLSRSQLTSSSQVAGYATAAVRQTHTGDSCNHVPPLRYGSGCSTRHLSRHVKALQAPRRALQSFASNEPRRYTKQEAEEFLQQASEIIKAQRQDCAIELLGAYRQGKDTFDAMTLMVTGLSDDSVPTGPNEAQSFDQQGRDICELLRRKGIAVSVAGGSELGTQSAVAGTIVTLRYTSKPCAGACRLFMTGDDSYIDFLKLFAEDAMGLTLSPYGLWRCTDAGGQAAVEARLRQSTFKRAGQASAASSVPTQGSSQSTRMEQQRKEMGLPEGLDLSLDLSTPSSFTASKGTAEPIETTASSVLHSKTGWDGRSWERVTVGQGSEADILDILGMAWIPPEIRFVRPPKREDEKTNNQ